MMYWDDVGSFWLISSVAAIIGNPCNTFFELDHGAHIKIMWTVRDEFHPLQSNILNIESYIMIEYHDENVISTASVAMPRQGNLIELELGPIVVTIHGQEGLGKTILTIGLCLKMKGLARHYTYYLQWHS